MADEPLHQPHQTPAPAPDKSSPIYLHPHLQHNDRAPDNHAKWQPPTQLTMAINGTRDISIWSAQDCLEEYATASAVAVATFFEVEGVEEQLVGWVSTMYIGPVASVIRQIK